MSELSKGLDSISQRASRHRSRFPHYLGVGDTWQRQPECPRHPELVESSGRLVGFPAGAAGHVQTACRGGQMRFEETVRKS